MTLPDSLYLALLLALLLLDHFVLWPGFLRRFRENPRKARVRLWSAYALLMGTMVFAGILLWITEGRTWEGLRMTGPRGWRLWASAGLVIAAAGAQAAPLVRIARARGPLRIRLGNPEAARILPRSGADLMGWTGISLTAGFCEEFVFRGYILWLFQPLLGLWGAAAVSVVAFGLAHSSQGTRGMLATGLLGALLVLVVLVLRSLYPAMALHAVLDLGQGLVAWLAWKRSPGQEAQASSGAT